MPLYQVQPQRGVDYAGAMDQFMRAFATMQQLRQQKKQNEMAERKMKLEEAMAPAMQEYYRGRARGTPPAMDIKEVVVDGKKRFIRIPRTSGGEAEMLPGEYQAGNTETMTLNEILSSVPQGYTWTGEYQGSNTYSDVQFKPEDLPSASDQWNRMKIAEYERLQGEGKYDEARDMFSGITINTGEPASPSERTSIAETRASLDVLDNLKVLFDNAQTKTGPITGRTSPVLGLFGMNTPEQEAFMAATAAFKNQIIREITGAQMSEVEAKRILKQVPDIIDPPERWLAKWEQSKQNLEYLQKRRLEILKQSGLKVPEDERNGLGELSDTELDAMIDQRQQEQQGVEKPESPAFRGAGATGEWSETALTSRDVQGYLLKLPASVRHSLNDLTEEQRQRVYRGLKQIPWSQWTNMSPVAMGVKVQQLKDSQ